MALLPIIKAPDPRLKTTSTPVEKVDRSLRNHIDDMVETMYSAPGMGLAAVQIGLHRRILVVDPSSTTEKPQLIRLINPELMWASEDVVTFEEGCLSLPNFYADITRPGRIEVRYLDIDGVSAILKAEGLLATCVQHEMDHLDGTLFVDHLSAIRRNIILRKLAKEMKQQTRKSA